LEGGGSRGGDGKSRFFSCVGMRKRLESGGLWRARGGGEVSRRRRWREEGDGAGDLAVETKRMG